MIFRIHICLWDLKPTDRNPLFTCYHTRSYRVYSKSKTKRAEQNRKAQQNFRKRREEHIKALESKALEIDELRGEIRAGKEREGEMENVSTHHSEKGRVSVDDAGVMWG